MDLSLADQELLRGARREARGLGYVLVLDDEPEGPVVARASPVIPGQPTFARFLATGPDVLTTLKVAIERLHGIVERDEPWPEEG